MDVMEKWLLTIGVLVVTAMIVYFTVQKSRGEQVLTQQPYWNVWLSIMAAFVLWNGLYVWIFNEIVAERMKLGDDATVAMMGGAASIAGFLLGMAQKFTKGGPVKGKALMPNYLFIIGVITAIALEIGSVAAYATSHDAIEMKGVQVGTFISIYLGIITGILGLASGLIDGQPQAPGKTAQQE